MPPLLYIPTWKSTLHGQCEQPIQSFRAAFPEGRARPIIAISQLSRNVESRVVKIPMLSDLRESGSLEQDADVVMFQYREDYYIADSDKQGQTEIIIGKNRNGPTGSVTLMYQSDCTKFMDMKNYK